MATLHEVLTFHEWWISEFGHPPLPEEGEIFKRFRSAFDAGSKCGFDAGLEWGAQKDGPFGSLDEKRLRKILEMAKV